MSWMEYKNESCINHFGHGLVMESYGKMTANEDMNVECYLNVSMEGDQRRRRQQQQQLLGMMMQYMYPLSLFQ
jgi:hypothetical protein